MVRMDGGQGESVSGLLSARGDGVFEPCIKYGMTPVSDTGQAVIGGLAG